MRGFLQISQNKLPKRAFRAMLPTIFTTQARKTSVSRDASDHFHRKSFQKDRFVRGFLEISQHKLPKRSFRARLPRNFERTSFQKDRFVRGFFEISQHKLAKRAFRAMLPTIFTEKASKTIVSCEASSKFQRTSFQKDRFVRGFFEISQHKLAKRAFRAMLPTIFTEKASKRIVSCEASSKFHSTSFQKDRFVRGFFEISQNNPPKRAFRARLPPNFIEQSFQNERFARCFRQFP